MPITGAQFCVECGNVIAEVMTEDPETNELTVEADVEGDIGACGSCLRAADLSGDVGVEFLASEPAWAQAVESLTPITEPEPEGGSFLSGTGVLLDEDE